MKNIKILSSLMLLLVAFSFTSCDDEPIDSAINLDDFNNGNNNNSGNFTAKVDGANFVADGVEADYKTNELGTDLNVIGLTSSGKLISFQIFNPSVGTRQASLNPSESVLFSYAASANDLYSNTNTTNNTVNGTITITEFNTTTNKVSGTFSFTGYGVLNTAAQVEITNGVFDNVSFTNNVPSNGNGNGNGNGSIAGSYILTSFNSSVPTDINGDNTTSTNLLNETNCFNNMLLVLNANNTFTADAKGIDINLEGTGYECFVDPDLAGSWSLSGNQLTLTYVEDNETFTDVFTVSGNTLTFSVLNGSVVGNEQITGVPVYLTSDLTIIYTKQ